MKKKNYKGRSDKRSVAKCEGICKTFGELQRKMTDRLSLDDEVKEFQCNVPMEGNDYTSDIVCTMTDGRLVVYECCRRHILIRPSQAKLLEMSRSYWIHNGVAEKDWRLVVDAEEPDTDEK